MTTSGSSAPTTNSRGEQVWNPQVGIYHKPALQERESYGGIIGALEDAIAASQGSSNKDYPENFAGIIAAIQDLQVGEDQPGSDVGELPPGSEIIVGPDGRPDYIVIEKPKDGDLWFDTRQGRLFVAVEDNWYQTNGADGLAFVQNEAPTKNIVQGQFWWDKDDGQGNLFIFTGNWVEADTGRISSFADDLNEPLPVWELVAGADQGFQTTATLPLANTGPKSLIQNYSTTNPNGVLPEIDGETFNVQSDYNGWLFEALVALELEAAEQNVHVGTAPPTENVVNGTLWYDTESLELSIYYVEDDGTAAWVPTSTPYAFDDSLATVTAAVQEEARVREYQFHQLQEALNNVNTAQDVDISDVENAIAALQTEVAGIEIPSLEGLVNSEYVDGIKTQLQLQIAGIPQPNMTLYATKDYVAQQLQPIADAEATHATKAELEDVRQLIPSLTPYATTADVTQAIANITNDYLPRTGGNIVDGLSWNSPSASNAALKFATFAPTTDTDVTFGSTANYWEHAWGFKSNDDFCWIYNDNNKVFSITKDGPACSQLHIGDFSQNDANGRVITNTIEVKSKLESYQLGFQRILAAAQSANTFDEFKGYLINTLAGI